MAFYPPKINGRFRLPACSGRVPGENAVGTSASFQCGCFARISLSIESETKIIREAGFQTNGCGFMIASADVIAESLSGKELTGLHSMDEDEFLAIVESSLGRLPRERVQCAHVVLEAVRAALADHRAFVIEEFRGEKALVCTCFGISEETIEAFIAANSPDSAEEVATACRAGSGCGSCRMLIQEMIDAASVR
ncbi:MAG: iron-sulfur cluster assembly scaffold protein [Pyrinomonadaceae bacterium]